MEPFLLHCADTSTGSGSSSCGMCMEQVRVSWRPVKKFESMGDPVMVTVGGGTEGGRGTHGHMAPNRLTV